MSASVVSVSSVQSSGFCSFALTLTSSVTLTHDERLFNERVLTHACTGVVDRVRGMQKKPPFCSHAHENYLIGRLNVN